jgi:hypothetical protein
MDVPIFGKEEFTPNISSAPLLVAIHFSDTRTLPLAHANPTEPS